MHNPIKAERYENNVNRISEILDDLNADVRERVDAALSELAEAGVFRIHREWSASSERALVCAAASAGVVAAVARCDWADIPDEVLLAHGLLEKGRSV